MACEFDQLKDSNAEKKEKIKKLKEIWRSLSTKPFPIGKPDKYAHVTGKLDQGSKANKSVKEYTLLVEDLRKQLKENNV